MTFRSNFYSIEIPVRHQGGESKRILKFQHENSKNKDRMPEGKDGSNLAKLKIYLQAWSRRHVARWSISRMLVGDDSEKERKRPCCPLIEKKYGLSCQVRGSAKHNLRNPLRDIKSPHSKLRNTENGLTHKISIIYARKLRKETKLLVRQAQVHRKLQTNWMVALAVLVIGSAVVVSKKMIVEVLKYSSLVYGSSHNAIRNVVKSDRFY